jgi:magnesium-transporting ATPase (P-type)
VDNVSLNIEGRASFHPLNIVNPHRHAIEELYAHLHSSARGLVQAEATQRLARHGANRIEEITGQSFAGKLLKNSPISSR